MRVRVLMYTTMIWLIESEEARRAAWPFPDCHEKSYKILKENRIIAGLLYAGLYTDVTGRYHLAETS